MKLKEPNKLLNIIISSKKLYIEPITVKEITDTYISWLNDPVVNQYLEVRHNIQTKETVIEYINYLRSSNCELFAIKRLKDHNHIGNISLTDFDVVINQYATYGLMIGDNYSRMIGAGGEASLLIIFLIFDIFKFPLIKVAALKNNIAANKTLLSLGFELVNESILNNEIVINYKMKKDNWDLKKLNFKLYQFLKVETK